MLLRRTSLHPRRHGLYVINACCSSCSRGKQRRHSRQSHLHRDPRILHQLQHSHEAHHGGKASTDTLWHRHGHDWICVLRQSPTLELVKRSCRTAMKTFGMSIYSVLAVVVVSSPSLAPKRRPTAPPLPLQRREETRASEVIFHRRCQHRLTRRLRTP